MKSHILIYIFLAGLIYLVSGCGGSYRGQSLSDEQKALREKKIEAEAYLFDAKLRREGKVNSFRLEIFQTDSVLGLGGRAYLGKGALKGRLTADSILIYFPTRGEYVEDAVTDFFQTLECPLALSGGDILTFFRQTPDSVELTEGIDLTANYANEEKPYFVVSSADCPWRIELTYDFQNTGWRVAEFAYSDGEGLRIEAKRREYKPENSVKTAKFMVDIPSGSYRIEP
ncbi:MAG: hypothetical protein JXA92_07410 [candidate division Zixibacteria bacterium]|nr:hypothetical protein [candidate division Zixibacteria bacterium]